MAKAVLTFLGVGEAFDENHINTSVIFDFGKRLLIDCGLTVPSGLWKLKNDPEFIDMVYITHFHGDHLGGLPALLMRMNEDGRKNPLLIIGQSGIEAFVNRIANISYPGSYQKMKFPLKYIEISSNKDIRLGNITFSFFKSNHVIANIAIKVTLDDFSLFVSGDGEITDNTKFAMHSSRYIVHECYTIDEEIKFHSNLKSIFETIEKTDIPEMVFPVHVNRNKRKELKRQVLPSDVFLIPEDNSVFQID